MMSFIHHSRVHTLDEKFFSRWNQMSAYVFGFWMADGYMHHDKHYKVSFASKDLDHLELVKLAFKSDTNIYHDKRDQSHELNIYSKLLFEKIIQLGGTPCKSRTLQFPSIPNSFLADFVRGYFDGDGSVHFITLQSNKKPQRVYRNKKQFYLRNKALFSKVGEFVKQKTWIGKTASVSIRSISV